MYKKIISYYLKKDVDPQRLEEHQFVKIGDNYRRNIDKDDGSDICCYYDSRRFVYVDYPWKDARKNKVQKYIIDLINDNLVEEKINYEWWSYIGRWQNYSEKKQKRIFDKLERLNKECAK